MMRVLVTGATGFVGSHVLQRKPPGFAVEAFVRPGSDLSHLPGDVVVHKGDLSDFDSLSRALQGADILLNVASLGFGHAPAILRACRAAKIQRAVFISTTAIFTRIPSMSKAVRIEAERLIAESGVSYTVLRPTMIYGTPRDRNIWRLIRFLRLSPFAPLVEGGLRLQQPIHVDDVAESIWSVLSHPGTLGGTFNIAGAAPLSLAEMVRCISRQLGKRVAIVRVPKTMAIAAAAAARCLPFFPHISAEQILRLEEDKSFDIEPARSAFGLKPMDFEAGIRLELRWL